jgi:site-specific recombinase XerD
MSTNAVTQVHEKVELTIDELIDRYELSNLADGKSPKTIRWYRDILRLFSEYVKRKEQGGDVTCFTIDVARGYILYLRNRHKFQGHPYTPEQGQLLSPRTVQCHVRSLKAFSSWLYSEGYTDENSLKNLKLPKAPVKIVEPLTPEEIKTVMGVIDRDSVTGFRNYAIVATLLDVGLRASEIADVILGQLNLDAGYIKVMGKGAKERIVPIGKFVQRTLWVYIQKGRPEPANSDCDYLFLSPSGKRITVNTIKLLFSRLAKKSGVERLHAHLCRHTFAVNYLLNGGDIFSLQQILGHTTLEMVRHYLHFTSSQIIVQHHKYSPMDKLQAEAESKEPLALALNI